MHNDQVTGSTTPITDAEFDAFNPENPKPYYHKMTALSRRLESSRAELLTLAQTLVELDRLISREDMFDGLGVLIEQARAAIAKAEQDRVLR